ncbi:MAG: hypothetical protein ACJ8GL_08795, partial [Bacillus sp. (in: firmicutes)]
KLPQVYSVARDEKESLRSLQNLKGKIRKRMMYFEERGYEDIKEAWAAGEKIDREIIIVDEASVLAPESKQDQVRNECKQILEYIAQVAGGLGYNLIVCSQYPVSTILPRLVKQNADARISFRLPTSVASNVILDESGAEDIGYGMRGRAIYKADLKRLMQVPILKNDKIDELLKPFIQEELVYGDASGEEKGTGLCNTDDISSVGYGNQVAATNDSSTRIEPECDESVEKFADIYTAFQGE